MTIESFDEVQQYINDNLDKDENIKNYVSGFVTQDRIDNFLNTEDGKKFLQPKLDTYYSKGLKSWQEKNLESLISAKVKELHPDADPRDIELNKIKAEFEAMKQTTAREKRTNGALKIAQEKKLPTDLIDFFIGNDDETTTANLEKFMTTLSARDEAIRLEFAGSNSYTPPNGDKSNLSGDEKLRAEIAKFMK